MIIDYDIETYPNIFSLFAISDDGQEWCFEVSDRKDQMTEMIEWLRWCWGQRAEMCGFNNVGFDYPVIHQLMELYPNCNHQTAYNRAMEIINIDRDDPRRWQLIVPEKKRFIPQLDLYLINHFDNAAKRTSLKVIEFVQRSDNIEDLPFAPGRDLTDDEKDVLLKYNRHDVLETQKFRRKCMEGIEFRRRLTEKYGWSFMNYNDTKIGEQILIHNLEAAGIPCYEYDGARRHPRGTVRGRILIGDIIFPYTQFESEECRAIHERMKNLIVDANDLKGNFKDQVTIKGFTLHYGLGGLHGSIESQIVRESDTHAVIDLDVTSYYPSLAIANKVFPAHLSETFCEVYESIKEERVSYKKGSAENAALKLALNGAYGKSNSPYSPFYDTQFTMAITVNGQLSLTMLVEQMCKIPGLSMIQTNTDGITILCPRQYIGHMENVCKWWERTTNLQLERADYRAMWIRDVNGYLAQYNDGKIKRKGPYMSLTALEGNFPNALGWHQNHSAMIVPKAVEAHLINGVPLEDFIRNHDDPMDFMLMTKVPRSSTLELVYVDALWSQIAKVVGSKGADDIVNFRECRTVEAVNLLLANMSAKLQNPRCRPPEWVTGDNVQALQTAGLHDKKVELQNITRYYVSRVGGELIKVMPPLKKRPDVWRRLSVQAGCKVLHCNDIKSAAPSLIDHDWYIKEARKLIDCLN